MAINTSWNRVREPYGNLSFNMNIGTEEVPDFYPLVISINLPMETAGGKGKGQIRITKNVGTNQPTPFDFSTVQGLKNMHAALPSWARGAFKEAVIRAINEDMDA